MFPADSAAPMIVQAPKASGLFVRLEPPEFSKVLFRMKDPLVVVVEAGVFTTHYHYLISYKGLPFYTKSDEKLHLPGFGSGGGRGNFDAGLTGRLRTVSVDGPSSDVGFLRDKG